MKVYSFVFLMIIAWFFSSCNNKLLNPLEGSSYSIDQPKGDGNIFGKSIAFKPNKSLQVRAIENCEIIQVLSLGDSAKVVMSMGRFYVGYSYLKTCYVSKGDIVKRGQAIGDLFPYNTISDNSLSISLRKKDKDTSIVQVRNRFKNK